LAIGLILPGLSGVTQGAGKPIEVKYSTIVPPGGTEEAALKKFKELLETRSSGEFKVNLFMSAVLGSEKDTFQQLSLGETEMQLVSAVLTSTYAPELFPFTIPFVHPNEEAMMKALDGELGNRLREVLLKKAGIRPLMYSARGPRKLTANRPLRTVKDLAGFKLRLPLIKPYVEVWKDLGTIPTSIPGHENYNALQMGVVDGQENPLSAIKAFRFYEVQKYGMHTDHIYDYRACLVSEKFYQRLTPPQREVFTVAATDSFLYFRKIEKEWEKELQKELEQKGMKFLEVDQKSFRARIGPAVERLRPTFAPDVFNQYVKPYLD
jgi:tripartite ATP-independent transporter DctP family solute receptor